MRAPPPALPDNRLRRTLDDALADVHPAWQPLLGRWRNGPEGRRLARFLTSRQMAGADIVPRQPFRALHTLAPEQVRVVILGQDPYHGPGQAEGLAFSVPDGVPVPPSLRNIRTELVRSLDIGLPAAGSLAGWVEQGVLLLNTALTVELGRAASHARQGWEALTDEIIQYLSNGARPMVFMLWGAHAHATFDRAGAGQARHLVLKANHPSPLSACRPPVPFIGCDHFRLATDWLAQREGRDRRQLDWSAMRGCVL